MNTLDQQAYAYLMEDLYLAAEHTARRAYRVLRRAARLTRFELIAGSLFLTVLTIYVLTLRMHNVYLFLAGAGCITASLALLFTDHHPMRKLQAISGMIGNALIIALF
jgi:hypothetical protein